MFIIYNGQATLISTDRPNTYQLIRKPRLGVYGESPFSTSGEDGFLAALDLWHAGKLAMSSIEVKRSDAGAITLSVTAKETGWKSRYSLLPDREYAIVWSEAYNAAGEYVERTEAEDYQSWSGILIPTKSRKVHYVKGNNVGFKTECAVEECKTSASEIPDRLFSHELPDDAVVMDMDKKIAIRNTEATQRDWDEIVQLIGAPKTRWWLWGSVAIAALVVLALLALASRARRRLAKTTPK